MKPRRLGHDPEGSALRPDLLFGNDAGANDERVALDCLGAGRGLAADGKGMRAELGRVFCSIVGLPAPEGSARCDRRLRPAIPWPGQRSSCVRHPLGGFPRRAPRRSRRDGARRLANRLQRGSGFRLCCLRSWSFVPLNSECRVPGIPPRSADMDDINVFAIPLYLLLVYAGLGAEFFVYVEDDRSS